MRADTAGRTELLGTLAEDDVQRRVSDSCAANTFMTGVNDDGTVACGSPPAGGMGDITGITTGGGSGLLGGCTNGTCSLSVDTNALQSRVTDSCPAGQQIRQINNDGSVLCDATISPSSLNTAANARCGWNVTTCSGEQCLSVCPSGYHVEGGGCDATNPGALIESQPGTSNAVPPDGLNPVTVFDRWNCKVATGQGLMQGAYSFCCTD
jgi:hypothetical protein